MFILICYDVATTSREGRRRLRRVSQVCQDYGQRVQNSVFECTVGAAEMSMLRERLLDEIHLEEDSLRIYHLSGKFAEIVETFGLDRRIDMEGPLVI